ncbi:MAG: aldo/keto reductase [Deltaproteobacteria bacterium]|nr:aldo/keto reductase [Deltaproteobacteria bacterium]MBW2017750.1 aldo/keto reductase [Deltaproteobacteria bacterium]
MEKRPLGRSEVFITPIIMGTWQAGKKMWVGIDDKEIEKAIRSAFDAGITTFDTAEEYGRGYSESLLGKIIRPVRKEAVLATKVFANHLTYDQVIAACNRSLERLKTDWIDLYQIHWPSGSWGTKKVPIEETMRAMTDLKEAGKIRAIGVSNFSLQQLQEAGRFGPIESLQPPYSLFWRQVEKDLLPFCQQEGISILAYSPMCQGLLTGKFRPGHRFAKGDHRVRNRLFQGDHFIRAQEALSRLKPIADRKGVTLGQLALAWVIAQPGTSAIAGARNADQAIQNALAAEIKLTDAELSEMDAISRIVTDHLDDNPVLWTT